LHAGGKHSPSISHLRRGVRLRHRVARAFVRYIGKRQYSTGLSTALDMK
jgi:hypothetical protein